MIFSVLQSVLSLELYPLWISAVSLKLTQTVVASQCCQTVACFFVNHTADPLFSISLIQCPAQSCAQRMSSITNVLTENGNFKSGIFKRSHITLKKKKKNHCEDIFNLCLYTDLAQQVFD